MEKLTSIKAGEYITYKSKELGHGMNITKLMKLLYIAYGYYFAKHGEAIFDEKPALFPFGPVFPTVRNKISISKSFDESEFDEFLNDTQKEALDKACEQAKHTATTLSEWSHRPQGPWHNMIYIDNATWGDTIHDKYIKEYFKDLYSLNNESEG